MGCQMNPRLWRFRPVLVARRSAESAPVLAARIQAVACDSSMLRVPDTHTSTQSICAVHLFPSRRRSSWLLRGRHRESSETKGQNQHVENAVRDQRDWVDENVQNNER